MVSGNNSLFSATTPSTLPMDVYASMGDTSPYPYGHSSDSAAPPLLERRPVPPLHLSIDSLTNYVDDCETASGGNPPAPLSTAMIPPPSRSGEPQPGPSSHQQVPHIHIEPESDESRAKQRGAPTRKRQ